MYMVEDSDRSSELAAHPDRRFDARDDSMLEQEREVLLEVPGTKNHPRIWQAETPPIEDLVDAFR